jgi:hypothetical protein
LISRFPSNVLPIMIRNTIQSQRRKGFRCVFALNTESLCWHPLH